MGHVSDYDFMVYFVVDRICDKFSGKLYRVVLNLLYHT